MDEPIQLNFVELVKTDEAARIPSVTPRFSTEARAVGRIAKRKLIGWNDFVAMQRCHGNLCRRREPEVVFCAAEAFFGEFR